MSEPPSESNDVQTRGVQRGIRWDALAAIIASLVGLLALIVAGYTAHLERQQVSAQVWPHLSVGESDFPPSLTVVNQGVGPAIVRSVQVLVDGKPQADWEHVFATVGLHGDIHRLTSKLSDAVLTPGQKFTWLNFEFTRSQFQDMAAMIKAEGAARAASTGGGHTPPAVSAVSYDQAQGKQRILFNRFWDGAQRSRMQVRICYCSTLGDCKLAMWAVGLQERQTKECKAVLKADQFQE